MREKVQDPGYRGTSLIRKAISWDPTVGYAKSPMVGLGKVAFSYSRGVPVRSSAAHSVLFETLQTIS